MTPPNWHAGAPREAGGAGAKDSKGQAVVHFLATTLLEFFPERGID